MTSELYIAVAIMFVIYSLLITTGINQMRHARVLGLGMDGYVMAGIWIWLAVSGAFGLILSLNKIVNFGMPVFVLYSSGHQEPYAGILTRQWAVIIVWLFICAGIAIRSYVMLRNARQFDVETRHAASQMHKQMIRFTKLSEQMVIERQQHDRVSNETFQEFRRMIEEIKQYAYQDEARQE
jgi:hypothetical protein